MMMGHGLEVSVWQETGRKQKQKSGKTGQHGRKRGTSEKENGCLKALQDFNFCTFAPVAQTDRATDF
jgi:hypothetical protein